MSRSKRDGRGGGGYVDKQQREVWSRRCPKVNMWTKRHRRAVRKSYKFITHRYERRLGRQLIQQVLAEVQ